MKKFAQKATFAAAIILASLSTASASLTLAQDSVMERTSAAHFKTLLDELPVTDTATDNLSNIVTRVTAAGGTDVHYDAAHADAILRRPGGAGTAVGDFVVTGGTAPAAFLTAIPTSAAGGADDAFEASRNLLRLGYRRLTAGIGAGVLGVGALNDGDDTALGLALAVFPGGTTEDNVTLAQLIEVLFLIRLKD